MLGDCIIREIEEPCFGDAETLRWEDSEGPLSVSFVGVSPTGHYRLRLGKDISVDVRPDGLETWQSPHQDDGSLDHFLMDQVIPRMLAYGGAHVVHAGAVRCGNSTILLVGPSGRGKSTLAASFDQSGQPLLGDDAIIINWLHNRPVPKSVYPSLRLFPDSIAALIPSKTATDPVAHYTAKRRVRLPIDASNAPSSVEIAAIFVLGEAAEQIQIRQLNEAESCIAIVSNSFALDPSDAVRAFRRLEASSRLARAVPAFDLRYPRDYARLPAVHDAILARIAG